MLDKLKLPFLFDAPRMQKEVNAFPPDAWVPHFNKGYYSGEWSAIPLRSVGGDPRRIFPDPAGTAKYEDTEHLLNTVYLKEIVNHFQCEKIDVRLLKLNAGSIIKEHKDFGLGFEDGEVRLHIPVTTNPQLEFYLNKERVIMQEGECWFLNFNCPHSVSNQGATHRIHLVLDCKINTWLRAFFA